MTDIINRLRTKKGDEGFTLIELLVVVVIIGVLVAIAVPVYLNYRKGAADKSAQSDVRGAISAIEQYYTDNGNTYPANATTLVSQSTSPVAIGNQKITLSDKTTFTYLLDTSGTSYVVCATNGGGSGKVYIYNSLNGGSVKTSTAGTPSVATCT
ncbi:type II secretion system protein [Paractinoplanes toevensis]|uniref:Pili assembly chaperone n=1 Tax=Paractinoplanes toevensis TaxID=571911 RepID=A0A919T4R5_9ACTN|nr:type II secretion system protein [Actinoplanes toevensis]GIM89334.1 pili assembly chaperone [Actinoplanes toevensis]